MSLLTIDGFKFPFYCDDPRQAKEKKVIKVDGKYNLTIYDNGTIGYLIEGAGIKPMLSVGYETLEVAERAGKAFIGLISQLK